MLYTRNCESIILQQQQKKKQANLWDKRLDVCLPEAEGKERRN